MLSAVVGKEQGVKSDVNDMIFLNLKNFFQICFCRGARSGAAALSFSLFAGAWNTHTQPHDCGLEICAHIFYYFMFLLCFLLFHRLFLNFLSKCFLMLALKADIFTFYFMHSSVRGQI